MTELTIILITSFFISLFVIYPFVKNFIKEDKQTSQLGDQGLVLANYQEQRDLLLNELRDIEFDFGLGKLSNKDYEELNKKYRYMTADILKKIEEYKELDELLDSEIESEILSSRNKKLESQNKIVCSNCLKTVAIDNFCSNCGSGLN